MCATPVLLLELRAGLVGIIGCPDAVAREMAAYETEDLPGSCLVLEPYVSPQRKQQEGGLMRCGLCQGGELGAKQGVEEGRALGGELLPCQADSRAPPEQVLAVAGAVAAQGACLRVVDGRRWEHRGLGCPASSVQRVKLPERVLSHAGAEACGAYPCFGSERVLSPPAVCRRAEPARKASGGWCKELADRDVPTGANASRV